VAAGAPALPLMPGVVLGESDRQAIRGSLLDFARAEIGHGPDVTCNVIEGLAAREIVAAAGEQATSLIVIGTHGRSGFERLAIGSVTEKVLRTASCPVLSVPPRAADPIPSPTRLFQRVLCAIDFSPCAGEALEYAASLAQEAGGRLTVLHVVEILPEEPFDLTTGVAFESLRSYRATARADAQARLEASVPQRLRDVCRVDTILSEGKPYREILRLAADGQHDVTVLGVHSRNPLDLFFFGSTAQHLVRRATCPVLTVRAS
jgi:nucleotide-binding universal stress UspA family protein